MDRYRGRAAGGRWRWDGDVAVKMSVWFGYGSERWGIGRRNTAEMGGLRAIGTCQAGVVLVVSGVRDGQRRACICSSVGSRATSLGIDKVGAWLS